MPEYANQGSKRWQNKRWQNNSSYFYTTSITSSTIRNSLLADYSIIANSYNSFADNILLLSKYINEKATVEGGSNNE